MCLSPSSVVSFIQEAWIIRGGFFSWKQMLKAVPGHLIVVIGASAGGPAALQQLVQPLPSDLPACFLIVVHQPASLPCFLPHILRHSGNLPAQHAVDGIAIEPRHIYIAPPGRHLLVSQATCV